MNNFLAGVDWNTSLACDDANSAASTACNFLLYAIDQFVPKKRHRKPANPIWSNSVWKHMKKIKRASLREFSKHQTVAAKAEYLRANAAYKRLNATLYKNYQCDLQNHLKSKPRQFWSYVNKQRKESGLPSNMTNGTIEVDTVEDIADLFRTQFCSVFSEENLNAQDVANATSSIETMRLFGSSFTINRDMVIEAVNQLKTSIGSGPDGIPSLILKRCLNFLAAPLAMVFNLSLTTGVFPECWKNSFIFPIHKKGCKRTVTNYRGIASLSSVLKLFEIVILEKLTHDCSHIISLDQHGFMPKRSTTTNLITFTSFITREIRRGHQVDAINTDLSAAFDKVNHEIALPNTTK
ncbi:uncharacterized protein LOC129716582 [Wyeomyia smithii]|uniref:uncharacterized protein LOC129716582 n=1 Tax=Wyeomyia smithii TaxID=174621 RepID=UPI002467EB9F|nr:uncharacterized protein LOC129716582 [Wyeomyia smithii]